MGTTYFILTTAPIWAACNSHPALQEWRECPRLEIADGEEHKNLAAVEQIWQFLLQRHATREAVLVNVGGGMICDLGGFAASTFKRGIPFIHIPTTLLAMVDAATGGKTGFDYGGLKNSIGTYAQPMETRIVPSLLRSLSVSEWLSGYGEMLKHALLDSEEHWRKVIGVVDNREAMLDSLCALIPHSRAVKERIVSADPEEHGLRRALNLGHTVGHAIEAQGLWNKKPIPHGYCVVWGMVCALYLSVLRYGFPRAILQDLAQVMLQLYGRPTCSCKDVSRLLDAIRQDKKNSSAGIRFALLRSIGEPVTDAMVSEREIEESIDYLFSI